MKLADILTIEDRRNQTDPAGVWTIRLFKEGMFYRMYQRSAFIMTRYKPDMNLVIRGKVISVGFPVSKLQSWIPVGFKFRQLDDNIAELVPEESLLASFPPFEESTVLYMKWSEQILNQERKDSPKGGGKAVSVGFRDVDFNELWLKILTFPVEQVSPMSCVAFVQELKIDIAKRITESNNEENNIQEQ